MPDMRRASCRVCGVHRDVAGPISWRGKCGECGPRLFVEACDDLHFHRGPVFELWRARMAACVGAVLVDDLDLDG